MEYKTNLKWNIRPWACKPCFTVHELTVNLNERSLISVTLGRRRTSYFQD